MTSRAPLQSQSGFMLLEVVISALLVALIAIGTFAGLEGAGRASADERAHAEATKLAQQDEERLRGMTNTALAEQGTKESTIPLAGLTFTVKSSVSFVSAAKSSLSCETTAGGANYIQTTSSVRWTGLSASRPAVTQSSIISTLVTALLVRVKNQNEGPVEGATVTLTGADTGTQTTPASGCVVFAGLTAGAVTIAVAKAGWVDVNGKTTPPSNSATVVNEKIATSEFQIAEPGGIEATFGSFEGGVLVTAGVKGDTFVASQAGIAEPSQFVVGVAGEYKSPVASGKIMFPFAKSKVTEPYTVYAGDCPANAPETVTAGAVTARSAKVTPNAIVPVSEPLEEPVVKVEVYEGTSIAKKLAVTAPESVEIVNQECENKKTQPNSATVSYKHTVKLIGLKGELTAETAHQPFAKKLEFCVHTKVVEAGKKFDYRDKVVFENKVKAGITLAPIYLKEHEKSSTEAELLACP
jgi:Tfp pilus assembly protein PilV